MATLIFRRLRRSQSGQDVIEMALVTPLLLLLVMGIIDFGFMFMRFVVLTNAAVEGARVATLPGYSFGTPTADAESRARTYATSSGVPVNTVTPLCIATTLPGAGGGTWPGVTCTVQHVYTLQYVRPIVTLIGGAMAANVTLTGRSTMRRQLGS
jgi:Flp pilus assembly protein TadG